MLRVYSTFLLILLAVCIPLFISTPLWAIEFGNVVLYSYLEEPLEAEVELVDSETLDISKLKVALASKQDFRHAGLDHPSFLSQLRFEVVKKNSKAFVKMISQEAILKSYVEILLELNYAGARIIHGYTLLLDPLPPGIAPYQERLKKIKEFQQNAGVIHNGLNSVNPVQNSTPESSASMERKINFGKVTRDALVTYPMTIVSTLNPNELKNLNTELPEHHNYTDPSPSTPTSNTQPSNDSSLPNPLNSGTNPSVPPSERAAPNARDAKPNASSNAVKNISTQKKPDPSSKEGVSKFIKKINMKDLFLFKTQFLILALGITGTMLLVVLMALFFGRKKKELFVAQEPIFIVPPVPTAAASPTKIAFPVKDFSAPSLKFSEPVREQIASLINEKINEKVNEEVDKDLSRSLPEESLQDLPEDSSEPLDLNNLKTDSEIGLKLQLASRYIDIQDKAQATSLLKDVIALGSAAEKMFAEKMLLSLQCST